MDRSCYREHSIHIKNKPLSQEKRFFTTMTELWKLDESRACLSQPDRSSQWRSNRCKQTTRDWYLPRNTDILVKHFFLHSSQPRKIIVVLWGYHITKVLCEAKQPEIDIFIEIHKKKNKFKCVTKLKRIYGVYIRVQIPVATLFFMGFTPVWPRFEHIA